MNWPFFMEENLVIIFHMMFWNRPRVSISDRTDLFIKRMVKFWMNCLKASASRRMSNNHEFVEARIFNVLLPDETCVLLHALHERNAFTSIFSFIWIHNNDRYLVFNCPFNLGNHRPQLKRIIQTNTSCPDSCPHSTRSLNQNESPLPYILSFILQ